MERGMEARAEDSDNEEEEEGGAVEVCDADD